VGRDAAAGMLEATLAALDLPDERAVLEMGIGGGRDAPCAECAEADDVAEAEHDRPGGVERAILGQNEARSKDRLVPGCLLEASRDAFLVDGRQQDGARRGRACLHHVRRDPGGLPAKLQRVDDRLHPADESASVKLPPRPSQAARRISPTLTLSAVAKWPFSRKTTTLPVFLTALNAPFAMGRGGSRAYSVFEQ